MEDEKPLFCDKEDPESRKWLLTFLFKRQVFPVVGLTEKDIKGEILDLGCGRGSVGATLKEMNDKIALTGVDLITSYQGRNFWELYQEIIRGDTAETVSKLVKEGKKFDFCLSLGLPPWAIENLFNLGETLVEIVKEGGKILIAHDEPIEAEFAKKATQLGFKKGQIKSPAFRYIWFLEKGGEDG